MIQLLRDALGALWHVAAWLTRDKGYAIAASSGADHELDYYTQTTTTEGLAKLLYYMLTEDRP